MNNILVFIETDNGKVCDVSLELLTKGRSLSSQLGCKLEALLIGYQIEPLIQELASFGVSKVYLADDKRLINYLTLPYSEIAISLIKRESANCSFRSNKYRQRFSSKSFKCLKQRVNCGLHLP